MRSAWVFDVDEQGLSVRHDRAGLVIGGGPFAVGDGSFAAAVPSVDEADKTELLEEEDGYGVRLTYGDDVGTVRLIDRGEAELGIVYGVDGKADQLTGCLPLVPRTGEVVKLSTGDAILLGEQPFAWSVPGQAGAVEHGVWRLLLPGGARIEWPVWPSSDREGAIAEARLVMMMPFPKGRDRYEMILQIV